MTLEPHEDHATRDKAAAISTEPRGVLAGLDRVVDEAGRTLADPDAENPTRQDR